MKEKLVLITVLLTTITSNGQLKIGKKTNTIDTNAFLQIESNNQSQVIVTKDIGRLEIGTTSPTSKLDINGDLKMGMQSSYHNGWIKLDGRSVNSLSSSQKLAAASIGFTINIPNANNSFPVQNNNALGQVSNSNSKLISQANLPNVQLTGSTSSSGSHSYDLTLPNRPGYCAYNLVTSFLGGDINGSPTTATTSMTGNHTHTYSINLNGGVTHQAIDITPQSISVNMFLYLGN